jgi:ABC-type transport system substrate-binding protein
VAREVVEFYGDKIGEHPVGTGPFRLVNAEWKRSSRIVLARNPNYREVLYDETAPEGDARLQDVAARFKGRRLPLVDRVQISVVEEAQPRWLSFLNAEHDVLESVPAEFSTLAAPHNRLAPNLARRGVGMVRYPRADVALSYFAMEHPVVGGYEPHKVALRRAIALGVDLDKEIRLVRKGQAIPGQSPIGPQTYGYDPAFKSEMSEYNPPKAHALLDLHGYVDRNGDGWRDQPDGQPLTLEVATQPDQLSRQFDELWKKNMERIGIRVKFFPGKWPEQLKAARAGKLMLWTLGSSAAGSDGQGALARLYGPQAGSQNLARFKNAEFDKIYERMQVMADGPEREALFDQAKRISVAYMPYKTTVHRFTNDLVQPWVQGYRRPLFWNDWWHMVDIDAARAPAVTK